MDCLYHYGSNNRCFGILRDHSIRMSDIRKSNDYDELLIFFPDVLSEIEKQYLDNPFPLRYRSRFDAEALYSLLDETEDMIRSSLFDGSFTNLVICFSEEADLLSQWRGYANDGKGICLGLSYKLLKRKCKKTNGVLSLEKITYISEQERQSLVKEEAKAVLEGLSGLRDWIVENMTMDDTSPDTDNLLGFNFHGMIESLMIESLKYKHEGFKEEKEWRLMFTASIEKNPKWIIGEKKEYIGPRQHEEIIALLRNRIEFNISEDNISPYLGVHFSELEDGDDPEKVVKELWLGPKSKVSKTDLRLFLAQNGYSDVVIHSSNTTYR